MIYPGQNYQCHLLNPILRFIVFRLELLQLIAKELTLDPMLKSRIEEDKLPVRLSRQDSDPPVLEQN